MTMSAITGGFELTTKQRNGFEYDLTHGHPVRTPFEEEKAAFENLSSYLLQPQDMRAVKTAEDSFVQAFLDMSRQEPQLDEGHFVYPSASQALLAAATTLSESRRPKNGRHLTAKFVSPVFDNIPGLFWSAGFNVNAVREENDFWLPRSYQDDAPAFEDQVKYADVFVLVTPNNPTGFRIEKEGLSAIANTCAEQRTALCIDRTFLNQPKDYAFDMHEVLADSGVSYATIDDTGKLWATQELKLSILTVSPDLKEKASEVHNTMQLCASPALMRALADLAINGGALNQIRELIEANRNVVWEAADRSDVFESLAAQWPSSELSVERIRTAGYDPASIVRALNRRGVGVLSLEGFSADIPSWAYANPGLIPRFRALRVSLARDRAYIEAAAERIAALKPDECTPIVNTGRP